METTHRFIQQDSRDLSKIVDNSIDFVVTSPPYPMIEMWDDVFCKMNPKIRDQLDQKNGYRAFDLMHEELDKVWEELDRVTTDDAIICINIGDATRKVSDFHLFHNHSRIIEKFIELGYGTLPSVLWHKPTNKMNKFMGSGMIPPNAYVTLEHEHILIFRKNGTRNLTGEEKEKRYNSAYFWEERNTWFSDIWDSIKGETQDITDQSRERAGSYPVTIPYRLINMYSVQTDTVLDPFLGTGTTSLAAGISGRDSVGVDIQKDFIDSARERLLNTVTNTSVSMRNKRIDNHKEFLANSDRDPKYQAENYDFGVTTKDEINIQIPIVEDVIEDKSSIVLKHSY